MILERGIDETQRNGNFIFLCFLHVLLFQGETDIEVTPVDGVSGLVSPGQTNLEQKKTEVTK
jgi:hypothetical protein